MVRIVKAGILDTMQDAGRFGYATSGINNNGPMDWYAMRVANALAGNALTEAVIEMHFPAAVIQFEKPALIALSGGDFGARINGQEIQINQPVLVPANSELKCNNLQAGCRVYLAIRGGFHVKPWLGSSSTNLAIGGEELTGRKLISGDCITMNLHIDYDKSGLQKLPWKADTASGYMDGSYFYFIKGPEWNGLSPRSEKQILQEPFSISPRSDRMAIRLQPGLEPCNFPEELVSSAVSMGTMQLLPSGEILVLMADHQTTGGYPRIGNIITAHLPKLAQKKSGEIFHLLTMNPAEAEASLLSLLDDLKILQEACNFNLKNIIN